MKPKAPILIAIALISYLFFASCVLVVVKDDQSQMKFEDRQAYNQKIIERLQLAQPKSDIIDLMGPPDITEAKNVENGQGQILFYRTHLKKQDGFTTQDECTGLLFINDKLIAWGEGVYKTYQELK